MPSFRISPSSPLFFSSSQPQPKKNRRSSPRGRTLRAARRARCTCTSCLTQVSREQLSSSSSSFFSDHAFCSPPLPRFNKLRLTTTADFAEFLPGASKQPSSEGGANKAVSVA